MSDALTPLRHVYDVEPAGAPEAPGGGGHAEQEALRQMRALLDRRPVTGPSPHAVAAAQARAAVVTAVLDQTEAAVERALAARPPRGPAPAVVAAILARAAEPAGDALPSSTRAEAAVLDPSLRALDRLPRARPDAAVIAAVEARAAEASAELASIRAVYLDAPAVASVEAALLGQSRRAVEQALAARPQPRPAADAVDAILARAAEASGLEAGPVADVPAVEAALLAQSLRALDRLPRLRPSAATLDAVRLGAATVGAAPVRDDRPPVSPDRAPTRPARRQTPLGLWASAGTLLVAALVALVVLPVGRSGETAAPVAELAEDEAAPASAPAETPGVVALARPAPTDPEPAFAPSAPSAAATMSGLAAAVQQTARPSAPAPTAPVQAEPRRTESARAAFAAAAPPPSPASTPGWDASDDVRALSLRLQELDAEDALAWDDTPAETFGVPASPSVGSALGLQSVRAGAPARARFRSDSTSVQR